MGSKAEQYTDSQIRRLKIELGGWIIAWVIVFVWAGYGLYQPFLKPEWSLSGIFLEITGMLCFLFLVSGFVVDVIEKAKLSFAFLYSLV